MSEFAAKVNDWLLQSRAKPLDAPVAEPIPQETKPNRVPLPKKIIYLIVGVTITFFVLVGVVTTLCVLLLPKQKPVIINGFSNVHGFVGLSSRPDYDGNVLLNTDASAEEQAAYLYRLASTNSKNTPTVVAYNQGLLQLNIFNKPNYIDLDTVIMKNTDSYFKIFYHIINDAPMATMSPDTTSCERWYYEVGMDQMAYQKVFSSSRDETDVPYANWDEADDTYYVEAPIFTQGQYGIFTVTNHTITAETIKDADVTYNEEEGYWDVTCSLNLSNADSVAYSLADIRLGTGDKNAKYTKVTFHYTVWDNGYMRTFFMTEEWSAKVVVKLTFSMDSNFYFSYYEDDCDFDGYKDVVDAKEGMGIE